MRNKTTHFCNSASLVVNGAKRDDAVGVKGFSILERHLPTPVLSASIFRRVEICSLFHAGGPDLHGVIEEHGCCRWRLLSAVCGTADVAGGDDGTVLTKVTAHFQAVTASFTLFVIYMFSGDYSCAGVHQYQFFHLDYWVYNLVSDIDYVSIWNRWHEKDKKSQQLPHGADAPL